MTANRVTERYNDMCASGNNELLHAVRKAALPPRFHAAYGHRLLPRPFFIDESQVRETAADIRALFDLLTEVPDRLFGGDLGACADALGIRGPLAALMSRFPDSHPVPYGRADLYHDGTSFKLLEFNVGSELGGADRAEIQRAVLEVPAFRDFADAERLSHVHTGQRIAAALRTAAAPLTGGAEPVVALVEGDLGRYRPLVLAFQEMMCHLGLDCRIGELHQLEEKDGRFHLGDNTPIDVILRYFTPAQVTSAGAWEAVEPVLAAHAEGRVVLFTPFQSSLYANKGVLALLSDEHERGRLTATESALVARLLPWTRMLTPQLREHCRDNRERLILKPHAGFAGADIRVGWQMTDEEWDNAIAECTDRGYIVQERVVPRREPVADPETTHIEDWTAVWSVFLTPDGYAGSHVRALPYDGNAVIGMGASHACRTSGVFLTPS